MAHARKQIREAAAAALGGLTLTGTNVFQSRLYALQEKELPGLNVYTNNEPEVEYLTLQRPAQQERHTELVIEGRDKADADIDDTLDDIAEGVEVALAADITLGGLVRNLALVGTETEIEGGDQPTGVVRLTYDVTYVVAENAPGTLL